MGCCSSSPRSVLTKDEFLMTLEDDLSLHSLDLTRLEAGFKAANRNFGVSWIRLQELYAQFNIPTKDIRNPQTAVGSLYKALEKDQNTYCTLRLIVLSVLLSQTGNDTKAKVIFPYFSNNEELVVLRTDLETILKLFLELACELLPNYVLCRAKEKNSTEIPAIEAYKNRLFTRKNASFERLFQETTASKYTESEFINALQRTKLKEICSSVSLRQFTVE